MLGSSSYLLLLDLHNRKMFLELLQRLGNQFLVVLGRTSKANQDLDDHLHLGQQRIVSRKRQMVGIQLDRLEELHIHFQLQFGLV